MTEPPTGPRPAHPRRPRRASQLRLHRRFHSRILRNCRDVAVWLPPGYGADPRRRHPVIYFHDGQNIFDPLTAFLGQAWQAGEAAEKLIAARAIPAPILVGVYNTGFNRMNEYAPSPGEFTGWDKEKCRSAGDGKRYARFVATELKPFIDARYRTRPGPRDTATAGSSMGGLIALYCGLWHPRVFGAVAAMSPSIWWDDRVAFRDFGRLARNPGFRVWLDTGMSEAGAETGVRLFRDLLVSRGWALGGDLEYREVPGASHNEAAWAARVGEVMAWLLAGGPERGAT
ncbi:MAG TPA: alpha/beta hydrolase-fold protein [Opitutaceae bacterium]|nr:alpha/beta hydrolase-fold protein [Opitutaceae bacterium]